MSAPPAVADFRLCNPFNIYTIGPLLGEGSYGKVFSATRKADSLPVAVKVIHTGMNSSLTELKHEINILKQCSDYHIVAYVDSLLDTEEGDLWIVLEYCGGGSVEDLVKILGRPLTESEVAYIVHGTLSGLIYLHDKKMLHRDIKCGNILLTDDGQIKLGDFGVSATLVNTLAKRKSLIGSPFWMAPEIIMETGYSSAVDIWSLGISIIEMAERHPPLWGMPPMRALFLIPTRDAPTFREPGNFSSEFRDFLSKCLQKNPRKRWTARKLMTHPFLRVVRRMKRRTRRAMRKTNVGAAAGGPAGFLEDLQIFDDSPVVTAVSEARRILEESGGREQFFQTWRQQNRPNFGGKTTSTFDSSSSTSTSYADSYEDTSTSSSEGEDGDDKDDDSSTLIVKASSFVVASGSDDEDDDDGGALAGIRRPSFRERQMSHFVRRSRPLPPVEVPRLESGRRTSRVGLTSDEEDSEEDSERESEPPEVKLAPRSPRRGPPPPVPPRRNKPSLRNIVKLHASEPARGGPTQGAFHAAAAALESSNRNWTPASPVGTGEEEDWEDDSPVPGKDPVVSVSGSVPVEAVSKEGAEEQEPSPAPAVVPVPVPPVVIEPTPAPSLAPEFHPSLSLEAQVSALRYELTSTRSELRKLKFEMRKRSSAFTRTKMALSRERDKLHRKVLSLEKSLAKNKLRTKKMHLGSIDEVLLEVFGAAQAEGIASATASESLVNAAGSGLGLHVKLDQQTTMLSEILKLMTRLVPPPPPPPDDQGDQ